MFVRLGIQIDDKLEGITVPDSGIIRWIMQEFVVKRKLVGMKDASAYDAEVQVRNCSRSNL